MLDVRTAISGECSDVANSGTDVKPCGKGQTPTGTWTCDSSVLLIESCTLPLMTDSVDIDRGAPDCSSYTAKTGESKGCKHVLYDEVVEVIDGVGKRS